MNKNQINRFEMHNAVIDFLDKQPEKWVSIPKVGGFKNELVTINDEIAQSQEAQQASRVYLGKSKTLLKSTIAQKADILNDAVEVFASVNGNTELENRMAASFSDLNRMRNADFMVKVQEVVTEAEKNKEPLETDYGTTAEQVEDLKNDIDQFLSINGQPRAYQIASVQATKDLEQLFSEAHNVLTNKLDKIMKIFKRRDTNFYNGYLASRVVVDH